MRCTVVIESLKLIIRWSQLGWEIAYLFLYDAFFALRWCTGNVWIRRCVDDFAFSTFWPSYASIWTSSSYLESWTNFSWSAHIGSRRGNSRGTTTCLPSWSSRSKGGSSWFSWPKINWSSWVRSYFTCISARYLSSSWSSSSESSTSSLLCLPRANWPMSGSIWPLYTFYLCLFSSKASSFWAAIVQATEAVDSVV